MSKSIFSNYLEKNANYKVRWINFFEIADKKLYENDVRDELTPYFGTPLYNQLSSKIKKKLFFEYVKFVAEAQIVLEQTLIYGFWHLRHKLPNASQELKNSINKMIYEEVCHSEAFRRFLKAQDKFDWPKEFVFPRYKWVRKFLAIIMEKVLGNIIFSVCILLG